MDKTTTQQSLPTNSIPKDKIFFRNRLALIRNLVFGPIGLQNQLKEDVSLNNLNCDGLIIILGISSLNSISQYKLANYLLFLKSSLNELEGKIIPKNFMETFILLSKNKLFFFTEKENESYLRSLTSAVFDIEIEFYFFEQDEDNDIFQNIKIAKFVEETRNLNKVAISLGSAERGKIIELEKWPLINSYGYDVLKQGFFTLQKEVVDLSSYLEFTFTVDFASLSNLKKDNKINANDLSNPNINNQASFFNFKFCPLYYKIDNCAILNFISLKVKKQETLINDLFKIFETEPVNIRLDKTEDNLFQNSELELLLVNFEKSKSTKYYYLSENTYPGIKVGLNSNNNISSKKFEPLYKTEYEYKYPSLHFTYENLDPLSGITVGRTFFLTPMQKSFPVFSEEDEKEWRLIESRSYTDSFFLFSVYHKIITIYREKAESIIINFNDNRYSLESQLLYELNLMIKSNKFYKEGMSILIKQSNIILSKTTYNLQMRDLSEFTVIHGSVNKSKNQSNNLNIANNFNVTTLKLEIRGIISPFSNNLIGGVIYCDSFLHSGSSIYNLTKDITPTKFLMTSNLHFAAPNAIDENGVNINPNGEYNFYSKIKASRKLQCDQISFQGISFTENLYNLDYLFPSSKDEGLLNYNQLFFSFQGKIQLFNDMIIVNDILLSQFMIPFEYINSIETIDEPNHVFMIINLSNTTLIPLTGLIRNEILLFIEKDFSNKRNINNFFTCLANLALKYNFSLSDMTDEKLFEYDLVFKAFADLNNNSLSKEQKTNQNQLTLENFLNISESIGTPLLSEIANDFQLTSILDDCVFNEKQLELEYEKNLGIVNFEELEVSETLNDFYKNFYSIKSLEKIKTVVLVGNSLSPLNEFSTLFAEYFNLKGYNCKVMNLDLNQFDITSDLSLTNSLISYKHSLDKKTKNYNLLILSLETNDFGWTFIKLLLTFVDFSKLNLINIVLTLDFTVILKEHSNLIFPINTKLFSSVLYDYDKMNTEEVEKIKNFIGANYYFSTKSFLNKNKDISCLLDVNYIYSKEFFLRELEKNVYNLPPSVQTIFDMKGKKLYPQYVPTESIIYYQKYIFKEELVEKYFKSILNQPLIKHIKRLSDIELNLEKIRLNKLKRNDSSSSLDSVNSSSLSTTFTKTSFVVDFIFFKETNTDYNESNENNYMNETTNSFFRKNLDQNKNKIEEYHQILLSHLSALISESKLKESEPVIYSVKGNIKTTEGCFFINCSNYYFRKESIKGKNISNENQSFHLKLLGTNLKKYSNKISKILDFFVGNFPSKKPYLKEENLTEEEKNNLNFVNFNKPIPANWYVDGPIFVDPLEKRHTFHPDFNKFLKEYLDITNLMIDEHNKEIDDLIKSMEV